MRAPVCIFVLFVAITSSLFTRETVHILGENETLYRISKKYGVSVESIIEFNNIDDPTALPIGKRIIIPLKKTAKEQEPLTYTAQKGDTFYSIAKRYGTTVEVVLAANNLGPDYILKVNDVLTIPGKNTDSVKTAEKDETADGPATRETVTTDGTSITDSTVQSEQQAGPQKVAVTQKKKPTGNSGDPSGSVSAISRDDFFWPLIGDRREAEGKLAGTEIVGNRGDPVVSISSGEVVWVGPYRGFSNVILIQSPDRYIYVYGGNEETNVEVGDRVNPGMEIGTLGVNPHGEKPLLFFTVFKDGKPIDPEKAPRV